MGGGRLDGGRLEAEFKNSKLTDVMKVESLDGNNYSVDFGGGDPEIAVADGTDQPGHFGIMSAVSVDAPDEWTVGRKKHGKVLSTGVKGR